MTDIKMNWSEYKTLLQLTDRKGIDKLINYLDKNGFSESPCSTKYHLNEYGGLLQHSLNVCRTMERLAEVVAPDIPRDSVRITALLHDIGKIGQHDKPNYIPNMVRSKSKNKETGEYDKVLSTASPFKTNPELAYIPHEVRSVIIASKFIELTEEEEHAIYYHDGKYTHIGYDLKETPLQMLLHFADLWAAKVIEEDGATSDKEVGD